MTSEWRVSHTSPRPFRALNIIGMESMDDMDMVYEREVIAVSIVRGTELIRVLYVIDTENGTREFIVES